MCSQIAVAVAVDGLATHAATDLFNLSQFSDSNNVGPRPWWPNRPPNIRKFWSTATATAICKSWWWLRLPEPIHGKFGRGCRWKSRLRLKILVVDGALRYFGSSLLYECTFANARLPCLCQSSMHPQHFDTSLLQCFKKAVKDSNLTFQLVLCFPYVHKKQWCVTLMLVFSTGAIDWLQRISHRGLNPAEHWRN